MVGMLVEDILLDGGCKILGPFITFSAGMAAAEQDVFDVAMLDVNLAGTKSYPIAETLVRRGLPFLLVSGYGDGGAPADHPEWPTCSKPFIPDILLKKLGEVVDKARSIQS